MDKERKKQIEKIINGEIDCYFILAGKSVSNIEVKDIFLIEEDSAMQMVRLFTAFLVNEPERWRLLEAAHSLVEFEISNVGQEVIKKVVEHFETTTLPEDEEIYKVDP
jgi:hypothetical protein